MKALVAFGTKYGSTADVAEKIAFVLRREGADVKVLDLRTKVQVNVKDFDLLVIGSGIIAGSWTPEAISFLEESRDALIGKSVALFACCGDVVLKGSPPEECKKKYLAEIASKMYIDPVALGLFGGVLDFERYGFLVKAILHGAKKSIETKGVDLSKPYDFRDWNNINDWASSLLVAGIGEEKDDLKKNSLAPHAEGGD